MIDKINVYRDGGTICYRTSYGDFYIANKWEDRPGTVWDGFPQDKGAREITDYTIIEKLWRDIIHYRDYQDDIIARTIQGFVDNKISIPKKQIRGSEIICPKCGGTGWWQSSEMKDYMQCLTCNNYVPDVITLNSPLE